VFLRDLTAALCVSLIAVPIAFLSTASTASDRPIGPLQDVATTIEEFDAAGAALAAGASVEQAVFEQLEPYRETASFQQALFELLFGVAYDASADAYYLELGSSDDLGGEGEFQLQGANALGDAFEVTVLGMAESDLSALGEDERASLIGAGVQRVWGIECVISTANGAATVSGAILHGVEAGAPIWRLFPIVDANSDLIASAVSTYATAAPGSVQPPSDPGLVDVNCAVACRDAYALCLQVAKNNHAGCLAGAASGLAAALALCAVVGVVSIWSPIGWGVASGCALGALAAFTARTAECYVQRTTAVNNCRTILNSCLVGCGYIIA